MAGFWDFLTRPMAVFRPSVTYVNSSREIAAAIRLGEASPVTLWDTQPHLRTVVSFVARNVAQLGLHVFERVNETDRRRVRDNPVARALADVDGTMTTYDLVYALVGDLLLYDRAYWFVSTSTTSSSGWMIRRLPPSWVSPVYGQGPWAPSSYAVSFGEGVVTVPTEQVLPFTGYAPGRPGAGSPVVETLKQTLEEQIEAARYRAQVWKRGGRVSAVLERPKEAPQWSSEAREQFREDWYAQYTGRGPKAGGTPILEDGMTLNRIDFNAQEQQFVEAAKLSMTTVASAFHVNPTMVGQLDNANYSNVREFRKMLYGDSLGPLIAQIEQRVNRFLLPMLGVDPERFYTEFNIAEKLQGNFEEQATAFQSAVGRPWMSADEARARLNLPAVGGEAESLVIPLNVLLGGQASPRDSGTQNEQPKGRMLLKARATDRQAEKVAQVLNGFFARQGKSVLSAIGAGGDWWDGDRWDGELTDDLHRVAASIAGVIGPSEAESLGFSRGDYDPDATVHYLRAVAERYASNINETTKAQLDAAVQDPDIDPAHVFDGNAASRAKGAGKNVATFVAGWATLEAARQITRRHGGTPSKTWVTGANPRPEHAAMNGETVPVDNAFSNGQHWPGEATGDPDDSAGCNCSVVASISR